MITDTTVYTIQFSSGNTGALIAQATFADVLLLFVGLFIASLMLVMVVRLWTLSLQVLSLSSSLQSLQMQLNRLPGLFSEVLSSYDVSE